MNEIYTVGDKKYRVGLINKDDFLAKNPTAKLFVEEEKPFGPQPEGKTSTTELDTTVDATEVSDTESLSADGSSESAKISVRSKTRKSDLSNLESKKQEKADAESKNLLNVIADVSEEDINSQVINDYYNLDERVNADKIFVPGPSVGVGAPGGSLKTPTIEEYLGPEKYKKYQADINAGYVQVDSNNEKAVEELTSQAEFKVKKLAAQNYLRSVPEDIQSKVNLDLFGEDKEFKSYEDAIQSIKNLNNFVVSEDKNIVKDKEEYVLKTKPYTEKLNKISSKIKQLTGGLLSGEKLESFSDIEQYNALVLEAQEVAAEYDASGFDDVYSSLVDRQEAFNIAIQNINSKEYKDKLDNIQNAKIAEDALSLDYSFTTRTAINLEEFFVGNTVNFGSLTAQLGLELLSAANPLAMFNDEGLKKIDRGIEIIKESTRDYNKELAKKREETLPESIKLDDIGSNKVGYFDWFKEATADNSATILTTFIPGGLAAKGAAGVRAATTVAAKKAALQAQKKFALAGMRTAQGVFFVAESGGKFKDLSLLEDSGLKNYSFAQKAFTSYAFGVTATLAETFGSLRLIQGGKRIAKDLGKKQFKVNAYKKPLNFSGTVVGKTLNGLTPLVTKAMPVELFEESITQVSHNALDVWVLDEKKSFLEGLNKDFFASTALTSFAIMSPKSVGNTVNIIKNEFRTKDEIFKNQDRVKELVQLQGDIPNLKGESLKLARNRKKEIIEELGLEDALSVQKLNSMSYEEILKVSEIKTMQRQVAEDMYALGKSGDVTELGKKAKQNLQTQYEQLQSQADALLNTKKVKIQQTVKALRESLGVEFTNLNAEYHLGLFDFYQDAAMTLMPKDGEYIVVEDISKIEEQLKGVVSGNVLSEIKKGFEEGSNAVNVGNSIIINKKAVEQNIASSTFNSDGKFSAASPIHELFHIYNKGKNIVDKNGELSESATKAVDEAIELLSTKKELGEISEKDYNDLINRFNLYKKGKGKVVLKSGKRGKAGVDSEEILAAMNDAVSLGIIKPSDMTSIPGLKELILGIAKDVFGQANWMFSLETSNDVFNFIKDYQKSIEESVSVQIPEDEDEQTVKESRIVSPQAEALKDVLSNEELVESIKSPTTEDKFSVAQAIVEKNWPVISKQIDFTPAQQDTAKEVVEEQILGVFQGSGQGKYSPRNTGLFNAFDPSVAQVNTYLGKTIASRKPEIDLAIKERAGVTGQDLSKAEGVTVAESTPAQVDTKRIKPSSLLPSDVVSKVKKEVKEKLKDVPTDKLTFKKLGNLAPEIIAEAIGIPVKKLTDATANLSKSDASAIQRFISQKPETLIKLLPEGAVLEAATQKLMGTSTGVPKSLLDAFYTKQDRTTDPSGLYPFKLNSNLNRANFLEAFGIVDGKKAKDFSPRSAEAQRLKGIASLFGRLVTNEIARTEGDLSLETAKDVAAGKSRLMFSKTLLEQEKIAPGAKKQFLEALKTNDFKTKLEVALKNKENSPWLKAANDYFTDNPIKGLDQKLIKKINKEISSIFSISDKGEVAVKRFSDKDINEVLKIINTSLDKDLTLGYSFDSVDLIQGDKNISKSDDFSLEGLNELRTSFKVLTDYLINKGYTKQELKSFLFGPFAKPANVGGFEIGNVKPDSFLLEKNNLGKEKKTSKGTRISRGAIMTGVPDLMNNFLSNAKEGESIPLSFDTYSKNFWLNPKSVFNRMNQAKKFEFLKDLFQKGQKTKLELLDVIDAIEAIDVPTSAKRHFTTQLFADMAAIGKRASGTRYVLTDSKGDMFSFSDLEKMNLTRPEGDKGVFEHTKPANRVAVAAYAYVKSKDSKIREVLLQELETFDSALITESMDDSLRDLKLQSKMGLDYNSTDSPMVTRYRELISSLSDQGVFFYDIKTDKLITPLSVLSEGLIELNDSAQSIEEYKKEVLVKSSLIEPKIKASKSNNNNSAFKFSKAPANKQTIETAATTDKALNIARDLNAPVKKIRVFDFDDTLAQTKSDVLYTMPDGTEGKLNAEQFASDGSTLLSEGAVFDFSEFNKVTEGKKGPLFKVAQTIAAKRGTEDVFVLTARAPESQLAIYEFLKSQGLDIPLKNITGLGNSTGEAKARWIVDKAADGYNDFYFADDAPQNVKAVKDALSVLDVKSKTQQAKIKFSKSLDLNKDFNDIIENKTGIASDKTYARVKAEVAGANKGRFNFFIPPSAEDFVGLLYSTLGKGDVGTAQMAWYKAHLLNPFARAMENLANDRVSMMQDYRGLKKALKIVPKDLRKKIKDSNFTKEQAVRVAIWDKQGMSVPGLSQKDQKELVDYVNADAELTVFAEQLVDINKGDEYASPDAGWVAGTIDTDFIKALNTTKRSKYLETWQQNADIIFSEANLNKLEAAYGKPYRVALENMLHRMKTGRNRSFGTDTITSRFTDWLTNSVGAIMFFNTRSAVLQTISSVNFINFTDNNVLRAGQAFANQPQYWSDFKKLFNSPFLLDRRSGIKLNVNEADIAEMAKGPGNSARNVVAGLLKLGFLPTQIADSFAIASGGATFYRNRIKALKKEGLTEAEAEEIAFRDFREIAEESQQSSRPDKISQQQAGPLGRIVLAFANTPAQYARLIKKAASDLKNGRGDAKTNISKIIYYGVAQNLLFSALQQALFAIGFGDEDEEEEKRNEKYFNIANGMADSILRGIGVGGAVVSVVKNTAIRLAKEADKKAPKYQDAVVKGVLQISPPVSSKVGKLQSAGRSFSWNQKEMKTMGFNIDNPAYLASAQVISAATNVPLDRAIKKITNIKDAGNENIEYYKRVALALGWSAWELGIKKDSKGKVKKVEPKTDMDKLYDLNKKQQIDSLLSLGLSKKQIKALKLEEDRVKAILDPKSIKEIKVSKRDSLFGLNKKEQVEALTKLGYSKKEIRALRLESDRVEAIINKQKQEN